MPSRDGDGLLYSSYSGFYLLGLSRSHSLFLVYLFLPLAVPLRQHSRTDSAWVGPSRCCSPHRNSHPPECGHVLPTAPLVVALVVPIVSMIPIPVWGSLSSGVAIVVLSSSMSELV